MAAVALIGWGLCWQEKVMSDALPYSKQKEGAFFASTAAAKCISSCSGEREENVARIKILHPEWELPGRSHSTKLSLKIFHVRPVVYGVLDTIVRVIPKRKPSKIFQKKNDKFGWEMPKIAFSQYHWKCTWVAGAPYMGATETILYQKTRN
ncbi:hypothetical protein BJ912DRAFT_925738 [Pholiota molesta]|nr:hypothetical protein BJ912DRAFT_925738 [Pholiota molesta]